MRALLISLVALVACGPQVSLTHQAPATFPSEPGGFEAATVERAVDGDTIEVSVTGGGDGPGRGSAVAGEIYDVRLIGIDSPESVRPGTPVECFGKEAAAAAAALLEGESVRMVKDVEDKDRYGRLLRYVYLGDEMANARLVLNGYASAYTYPPNVRHADLLVSLQREARRSDLGLWAPGACPEAG
jgi:micrococcal nuclease